MRKQRVKRSEKRLAELEERISKMTDEELQEQYGKVMAKYSIGTSFCLVMLVISVVLVVVFWDKIFYTGGW